MDFTQSYAVELWLADLSVRVRPLRESLAENLRSLHAAGLSPLQPLQRIVLAVLPTPVLAQEVAPLVRDALPPGGLPWTKDACASIDAAMLGWVESFQERCLKIIEENS